MGIFLALFTTIILFGANPANAKTGCENGLLGDSIVKVFLRDPNETYRRLRKRISGRARWYPESPFHVRMPEYLPTVGWMVSKLRAWRRRSEAPVRQFIIDPLLEDLEVLQESGIPYDDLYRVSMKFIIAMEYRDQGKDAEFFQSGDIRRRGGAKTLRNFWDRVEGSVYLPTIQETFQGDKLPSPTEVPLILISFESYSLRDMIVLWAYNTAAFQLVTESQFFDGHWGPPLTHWSHDRSHAAVKFSDLLMYAAELFPGRSAPQLLARSPRLIFSILDGIDSVRSPLRREALIILLFEILHEFDIPPTRAFLEDFLHGQLNHPREGQRVYSIELMGELRSQSSDAVSSFADLRVAERVASGYYGPKIQKRFRGKKPKFWFETLEILERILRNGR